MVKLYIKSHVKIYNFLLFRFYSDNLTIQNKWNDMDFIVPVNAK